MRQLPSMDGDRECVRCGKPYSHHLFIGANRPAGLVPICPVAGTFATLEDLPQVQALRREIAGHVQSYAKLNETYTKLSDIWMSFQATARPTQRDVTRAEAVGEFARLLAEAVGVPKLKQPDVIKALISGAYKPEEFEP